jgi:NitT/TauT family transport system substrate-binding protein
MTIRTAVRGIALGLALSAGGTASVAAQVLEKVSFGTNWLAEAEHGGFYQAIATGIYRKYGLDVDLRMGGPQQDPNALLLAGRVDFIITSGFSAMNYARENLPFMVVATTFQKDPQILMAHPGVGHDRLEDLKGKPILISAASRTNYWAFLKGKFGYSDEQIRPYTFSLAPYLADKSVIMQGFITSEPFLAEKAGVKPVVMLLADAGYSNYQEVINTSRRMVETKPDTVQRFVNASIEGWYSYLKGDPGPGNALIKKDNPEMTDEVLAFGIKAMNDYGVIDSGDAKTLGIGAMTDARWESFYKSNVEVGVFPPGLDYKKSYTLQFVNKKVGM